MENNGVSDSFAGEKCAVLGEQFAVTVAFCGKVKCLGRVAAIGRKDGSGNLKGFAVCENVARAIFFYDELVGVILLAHFCRVKAFEAVQKG